MYERRKRLSSRQQDELIKLFVEKATARTTGELVGVHRNTAISYFMRLRRLIASHLPSYRLSGEVEVDERYYCGWLIKTKINEAINYFRDEASGYL